MSDSRPVKLLVINDLICPYCYMASRELHDAVAESRRLQLPLEFEIEYIPFRLISSTCLGESSKVDKMLFYSNVLGEETWAIRKEVILQWAAEKGIKLSFGGVISQTTSAQRLSRKAYKMGGQNLQLPLITALFKAFNEDEKDIGDLNVLAELAENVGMLNKQEAIQFLQTDELKDEVYEYAEKVRLKGFTGIPVTVIDSKWLLSGSQSSDTYVKIFQKLAEAGVSAPSTLPGVETCPSASNC
jgi:predicted DsbA family dithiol-disulfide isomerase